MVTVQQLYHTLPAQSIPSSAFIGHPPTTAITAYISITKNENSYAIKKLYRMMIKNNFDFKWVSFFRCSNANDETFALMAESGCIAVYLGVESGDQTILNHMNKFAQI